LAFSHELRVVPDTRRHPMAANPVPFKKCRENADK
jgi:hypothetical protein